ncbi:MAG: cytochrome c3 family protein [Burkholderiales bacterium]
MQSSWGLLQCLARIFAVLVGLGFAASGARAQALESVLAPGKLIQAHAKLDEQCTKCHVKFDRNAQDGLCVDCHKDVGQDLRTKTGFHGRMKQQSCKTCHADHKGREANAVAFDKTKFDHEGTNFALNGSHRKVECAKCHLPTKAFRVADRVCAACHRKDDVHKGSLGPKCADCHNENSWKEAKFDHDKSRFALLGKHGDVKCADCHKNGQYRDTPRECNACHKKDDKHKGQFGAKCETCHEAKSWKNIRFNHDTDTRYPLLGKHHAVKCETCHTGALYQQKLSSSCIDCHKSDDKHKGTLGTQCGTCHTERSWKEPPKFNHAKTAFPLLGKHADVQCKDCHKTQVFNEAPKQCIACHRKDDRHKGSLGEKCADCHNERSWKQTSFDHDKTRYPLLGKHKKAECGACHKSPDYKQAPKDCFSCHERDDKHAGQQGRNCMQCHVETDWKSTAKFDHGLTKFPLLGKHGKVECKSCHASARFKDAKSDCVACHVKDDKHKKTLGPSCGQCHSTVTWKSWDFDHDKRTKFVLDGKHKGLICSACHTKPMDARVTTSALCVSCHAKDDVHDGNYGRQCQQCHVTSLFRNIKSQMGRP